MKRYPVLVSIFLFSFSAWGQKETFSIQGVWKNNPGIKKLLLWYVQPEHRRPNQDTAEIKPDGSFSFSGTVEEPVVALIRAIPSTNDRTATQMPSLQFYLENATININITDQLHEGTISGSALNNEYLQYLTAMKAFNLQLGAIAKEATGLQQGNNLSKQKEAELIEKSNALILEKEKIIIDFIKAHPTSFISLFALRDYGGPFVKPEKVEPVFNLLSTEMKSSLAARQFADLIANTKQVQIGSTAPDIKLTDIQGRNFELSSLRGKYVLVDFWASWCKPCRAMNPELVKTYEVYQSKKFEIVGVSFDTNKKDWMNAVANDRLNWLHISELEVMENSKIAKQYGVVAVPQNFLLNPDGVIVARNISGEKLNTFLRDNLK